LYKYAIGGDSQLQGDLVLNGVSLKTKAESRPTPPYQKKYHLSYLGNFPTCSQTSPVKHCCGPMATWLLIEEREEIDGV
jgi:hypothetical protein